MENNEESNNSSKCCLLIICPGCHNLLTKCKFISHCENECQEKEIFCINKHAGCDAKINRHLMRYHLQRVCKYPMNSDDCHSNGVINDENIKPDRYPLTLSCTSHCFKCITSACAVEQECAIIACSAGCQVKLHSCKLQDHLENICKSNIVPCINRIYGCRSTMARSSLNAHLVRCESSLISCSRQWIRGVQSCKLYQASLDVHRNSKEFIQKLHHELVKRTNNMHHAQFLYGMSLRDKLYLVNALNDLSRNPGSLRPNFFIYDYDSYGTADDAANTNRIQSNTETTLLGRPSQRHILNQRYSPSQYYWIKRVSQFMMRPLSLWSSSQDPNFISDRLGGGSESLSPTEECNTGVEDILSTYDDPCWQIQNITSGQLKPAGTFLFHCGQAIPRRDWEGHWRQHCDISEQMDGWIELCCPLASLGCKFSVMRLGKAHSSLYYQPLLDTYCQRFDTASDSSSHVELFPSQTDCSMLLRLPFELLVRVCSFLDGCSLLHASRAHLRLSHAVEMLFDRRCSSLQWTRSSSTGGWISHIVSFRPVSLGSLETLEPFSFTENSVGVINSHLSQCSYKGGLASDVDTPRYCLHRLSPGDSDASILPEFLRSTCR